MLNKYKAIQGEWTVKDVERFVEELTGANVVKDESKTTDAISHQAIRSLRDGVFSNRVNPSLQNEISNAASDLQSFVEAQKGESDDLIKWKRDKFDNQQVRYIHRFLIAQRAKGKTQIDEQAYRDLHFSTTKYLELLGSVEFNAYM